jgi:hypothetical protein
MHCFSTLFDKELFMFRTDLLSIIRSLYTVFTAIGICHTKFDMRVSVHRRYIWRRENKLDVT